MITNERRHVPELGLRRIFKARSTRVAGISKFTVPTISIELIDWQNTNLTEPPLITDLSDAVIKDLVTIGDQHVHCQDPWGGQFFVHPMGL